MAIPFYENEEHIQPQQHSSEEIDQVDGPIMHNQNQPSNQDFNSPTGGSLQANLSSVGQQDFMAWKVLALAMCKALKDHYQQNMANSSPSVSSHNSHTNNSSSSADTQTAVIQILPNGQVKPQWN